MSPSSFDYLEVVSKALTQKYLRKLEALQSATVQKKIKIIDIIVNKQLSHYDCLKGNVFSYNLG